jgi:tetratricopeptide (TPR) repeat protein
MSSSHPHLSVSSERIDSATRLVGWKDIAAYLGKTDRTVKRWGRERGLPIHRVPGSGKTSVYAYPAELDNWLDTVDHSEPEIEEKSDHLALEPAVETSHSETAQPTARSFWSPKQKWATALAALLLAALALDVATRLTAGTPPVEAIHRLFTGSGRSVKSSSLPVISEAEQNLANDFYLRGRYEWNQRTPESLNRALDLFTQAIVHDPGNARAYAGLADTYDLLREYSTETDKDAFSRAIVAARKAVVLDDSLPEAHRALAYAEMYGSWDFADAEKEFQRAIELDSNDAQARLWYANALGVSGRFSDALEQMNKAQELNPSSPSTLADKGLLLYGGGHTEEGIELLKEVERSVPNFRSPHYYLMRIDLDLHNYADFLAEGDMAAQSANDPIMKDILASARAGYKRGGGRGLLGALYAKQKEYYLAGKLHANALATTCVLMGRKQEALGILEDAYNRHDIEVLTVLSQPDLVSLRNEPRYQALVRKINFPQHSPTSAAQNLAAVGFTSPAVR